MLLSPEGYQHIYKIDKRIVASYNRGIDEPFDELVTDVSTVGRNEILERPKTITQLMGALQRG